jgi:hypothetical protein
LGNIGPLSYTKSHKNPIKDRWLELSPGRQKGKAKQRPKDTQRTGTKKRERANLIYKFTTSVHPSVTELGCASPADRARPGTLGLAHGLVA